MPVRLLLISGSFRRSSTNTAVLRTAAAISPPDVEAELYAQADRLPHFNPDDDVEGAPPEAVAALRTQLDSANAVLICTPEYAGALPGSLKNLLEWTVGGVGLYGKPVAWINALGVAAPPVAPMRTSHCARCSAMSGRTWSRRRASASA